MGRANGLIYRNNGVRRCCQDAYAYWVDRETDSTRSDIVWFELGNGNRIFVLHPPAVYTSRSGRASRLRAKHPPGPRTPGFHIETKIDGKS